MDKYKVAYDPETDLWVIMEDGFAKETFPLKWQAVKRLKELLLTN